MLTVNIDTTNTENAFVDCRFMFPRYSCTIVYGEDPSYNDLVYSDTSTTEDEDTTITLSQDLRRDTTYYFIVSANGSSRCERVRGRFQTGGCIKLCCMYTQYARNGAGISLDALFYHLSPGNIVRFWVTL